MSSKKSYNSILNKFRKASIKEKVDVIEIINLSGDFLSVYFRGKDLDIELSREEFQHF